ncbi:MAG: FAD-dependent oxidoreductase [bacterium]|nr:FAD-dependent oxidoreductase [bacterium]
MTATLTADLCVVGAGSGGFAAACSAARLGVRVILLEAADGVGGTSIRTYPNGDLNMNPLHLMTGAEAFELGSRAREVAFARARLHWHLLQTRYADTFGAWKRTWMSPALGVRETHRLVGRYVLREQDLDAGLAAQDHDDIIAIADHSVDFHGARPSRELDGPYGIPFRCLLPKEVDNLIVACRGASFSSIGASSCRLSRTMMVLGQAAGTAVALFGADVMQADPHKLRNQLSNDDAAPSLAHGWLDVMADIAPIPAHERMPRG